MLSVWTRLNFVVLKTVMSVQEKELCCVYDYEVEGQPCKPKNRILIDRMVFYATFNSISVISQQRLTFSPFPNMLTALSKTNHMILTLIPLNKSNKMFVFIVKEISTNQNV